MPDRIKKADCICKRTFCASSGWIPCSKKLPGHGEEVLICTTDGSMTTAEYDNGDWWLVSVGCLEDSSVVTHWMPLPEPPEMNGENENDT